LTTYPIRERERRRPARRSNELHLLRHPRHRLLLRQDLSLLLLELLLELLPLLLELLLLLLRLPLPR
jgi:hypothetical protein